MTKKILAVLMAVSLVLTCGIFAMAEETPTDIKIYVTFNANTGEGTMADVEVVDGKITVPECTMQKANYEFIGWNTNADGSGDAYQPGEEMTVTDGVQLYAQWAKAGYVEYFVTYNANGGEGEDYEDDFGGYVPGSEAVIYDNDFFTREGWEFKEWNTKADGTGTSYAPYDTMLITDADVTLYAIWTNGEEEPGDDDSTVTPPVSVLPAETTTDTDSTNPDTGDAATTAIALGAGVVALGALVVLKKKN